MMVIKVVVHDSGTTILKGALFKGESLIADATGALRCLHEEREPVGAEQGFLIRFQRLRFDGLAGSGFLLDAIALDRFSLVA